MNMKNSLRTSLLALLIAAFAVVGASAQLSTASMFGTVTDATGAVVPNATVAITQTSTNETRTVVTNKDGAYRADFLPVGPYKVRVTAKGFKILDREGITLTVTEDAHLDLPLSAGGEA